MEIAKIGKKNDSLAIFNHTLTTLQMTCKKTCHSVWSESFFGTIAR